MTKLSMSEEEMLKRKYTRPYEKRIAELEAQIEKMKSPLNCKHSKENGFCMKGNGYCICDKWELED